MIFGFFVLAVALTISAVAAYYSIAGLTAIFAAAVMPIIIMGASLEAGKIVATVWLHRFWHRASVQFKLYLVPAIVVLMLITSMGIFGFLSKAHMDQGVVVGDSASQVSIIDEKIATQKSNIDSARTALKQMDAQVNELLGRTTDDKGANRAVQVRKQQAKERKALQDEITQAQKAISQLQNERAPLAAQTRKIEAEVGPIKYIAALIYGDNPDANLLERAVRWVIILLVFVFDPLALVLILAAEQTIFWAREDLKKTKEGGLNIPLPKDDTAITDFFARGRSLARIFDRKEQVIKSTRDLVASNIRPPQTAEVRPWTDEEMAALEQEISEITEKIDDIPDLPTAVEPESKTVEEPFKPDAWVADVGEKPTAEEKAKILADDEIEEPKIKDTSPEQPKQPDVPYADPPPIRGFQPPAIDETPINPPPKSVQIDDTQVIIPNMALTAEDTPPHAGFGTEFPTNPQRGDMYLRVDFLPSRLYKWNDKKWIEVSKEGRDTLSYDTEYIKHLIDRIDRGEYDVDLLTDLEREQIQRYLNDRANSE